MISTILADDEILARQKLRQMLLEEREIELIGESGTTAETLTFVRREKPDLLFLDIRMHGRDAFEVVEELSSDTNFPMPAIVFTTAHDSYALRAFEVHAADYLLKPFTSERLRVAIQRAMLQIQSRLAPHSAIHPQAITNSYANRIVFKSRGRILFLPVSSIRWIGAEENYVRICTEGESYLLREPIGRLEEKLDPQLFLRVHRSAIVNLQFVKEVRTESTGESVVILLNGQKLSMSRSYRSRINEWLTHG
ncbi:MAG TPA: LytTR family DNA-binding domain-containing protein [Terracidiphilus sp.]|jgi:two-component system LytT family response regulator